MTSSRASLATLALCTLIATACSSSDDTATNVPTGAGKSGASGGAGASGGKAGSGGAGSSAGQAGSTGGQAGFPGGQAGAPAGQAGASAGQAGAPAGQAGSPAGQAGAPAGQAGQAGAAAGQAGSSGGQAGASAGQGGAPLAGVIQLQITQECREGGVKFVAKATTPFPGTDGYSFAWNKTSGDGTFTASGNSVVSIVMPAQQIHFDLVVGHAGYTDQTAHDVWSATCMHDDNPTDCPENDRPVKTNQESYAVGDTIEMWLEGTEPDRDIAWYVLDGVDTGGNIGTKGAGHLVGKVTALPIRLHAQPSSTIGMAKCHGWTERFFF